MCDLNMGLVLSEFNLYLRSIHKPKAYVNKVILLVTSTVTVKAWRLIKINSVCVDKLIYRERSRGETEDGQNPPHILCIFISDTGQNTLVGVF
jgi:hypothetical protein